MEQTPIAGEKVLYKEAGQATYMTYSNMTDSSHVCHHGLGPMAPSWEAAGMEAANKISCASPLGSPALLLMAWPSKKQPETWGIKEVRDWGGVWD